MYEPVTNFLTNHFAKKKEKKEKKGIKTLTDSIVLYFALNKYFN